MVKVAITKVDLVGMAMVATEAAMGPRAMAPSKDMYSPTRNMLIRDMGTSLINVSH